ncbi:hypothetical protein L2E82_32546 [Cichorium intybus]|uniref:Uncharacterized protein n=1 Tax=Cichorium intybus TaxID=13427 RepID=A0ACB9BHS7_CICIN|nr:hypothetical protein L2E82_32546 [Cichorium intybus]
MVFHPGEYFMYLIAPLTVNGKALASENVTTPQLVCLSSTPIGPTSATLPISSTLPTAPLYQNPLCTNIPTVHPAPLCLPPRPR